MVNLEHGMVVLCTIREYENIEAVVSINERGRVYLCQDHIDGAFIDERFGKRYSYYTYVNEVGEYDPTEYVEIHKILKGKVKRKRQKKLTW